MAIKPLYASSKLIYLYKDGVSQALVKIHSEELKGSYYTTSSWKAKVFAPISKDLDVNQEILVYHTNLSRIDFKKMESGLKRKIISRILI